MKKVAGVALFVLLGCTDRHSEPAAARGEEGKMGAAADEAAASPTKGVGGGGSRSKGCPAGDPLCDPAAPPPPLMAAPAGAIAEPLERELSARAEPALSANARYATTYRPGRGYIAAFDSAVAQKQLPASYKEILGDVAGRYAGSLPAPTTKALAVAFEGEQSALGTTSETIGLRVSLRGNDVAPERAPLAVYLVLDTSGSMSGKAIENARKAAEQVVKKLRDTDTFSMVTFASEARVLVESAQVGPARESILAKIRSVEATGGTNIGAGLDLAYQQARGDRADGKRAVVDPVQVTLLLSDGEATAGDTNPASLAARATNAFQEGIQTSAFGVGEHFDAPLMSTIADRGAGGYYFLADSAQIASALTTELDARVRPVATAVELRVRLGDGVVPIKVFGSRQLTQNEASAVRGQELAIDQQESQRKDIAADRQEDNQSGMRFFLPSFSAGDKHATLLRVQVPAAAAGKTERQVATLEVRYKDRKTLKNEMVELPLLLKQGGVAIVPNKSVRAAMLAYGAGDDLLRAADLAQSGHGTQAAALLHESEKSLQDAATRLGEPGLAEDATRLGKLAGIVSQGREKPMALAVLLRGSGYGYLQ